MWKPLEQWLRATQSAHAQQQAERPPYTGPLRRRTDPIEVEARVVEDEREDGPCES